MRNDILQLDEDQAREEAKLKAKEQAVMKAVSQQSD